MVKVVGKDEKAIKRITCKNCASILEYTQSETKRGKFNVDWTGDGDDKDYIDCPTCNDRVVTSRF